MKLSQRYFNCAGTIIHCLQSAATESRMLLSHEVVVGTRGKGGTMETAFSEEELTIAYTSIEGVGKLV